MEIQDKTVPYEILIRFNPDGKPRGAHAQNRRVITLDGEIVKDEILDALPLDIADFPSSSVMSGITKDALSEISRLNLALDAANEEIQSHKDHIEAIVQDTISLKERLATALSHQSAWVETPE